jgi:aspartate racemase
LKRVGLFGTRFTMQAGFFTRVFAKAGIAVVTPEPAEREVVHEKYMDELVRGSFLDATRERLLAIAQRMRRDDGIEALILGGTELPLLFRQPPADLPMLDTGRLHVEAAVEQMLS